MFGPWDLALVGVVSIMVTVIAYVRSPEWKAFVLLLPIPFTVAVMAVGKPVDATNVLGLVFLYIYARSVRILHYDLRIPIVLAILIAACLYCAASALALPLVPRLDRAFWIAAAGALAFAVAVALGQSRRSEPDYRSSLPLWIKVPAVVTVVCFLVVIKHQLQGFITTFPMVALVGAYEARKSLYALTHQIPFILIMILSLMTVSKLTYENVGLGPSLVLGWIVLVVEAAVMLRWTRSRLDDRRSPKPVECTKELASMNESGAVR
jgi:hypothetical protein